MSKRLPTPCAQWAERLSQASFGQLSNEEGAVLKAHLSVCPACAAARAEYLRAATLLRQAPDPDPLPGLPPSLLRVWAAEAGAWRVNSRREAAPPSPPARAKTSTWLFDRRSTDIQEIPMQTLDNEISPASPPRPPIRRQLTGRRTVTIMGALAAVLVLVLVTTALVASRRAGKPGGTVAQPTTSATPSQTQPGGQAWRTLPHLTNLNPSDQTLLAPSDPRVVYQVSINPDTQVALLRRSDDQGATWRNLPLPSTGALPIVPFLSINPANAQDVLLINHACLPDQTAAAGAASSCSTLYFSNTGGESWAPATLPLPDLMVGAPIFAQENRLYVTTFFGPKLAPALIVSSDAGATWQAADQGLGQGQDCVVGAAVPPTGTTLFAATLVCGQQATGTEPARLWRSDDAGAHWAAVSSISETAAYALEAVNVSGQAQPVLLARGRQDDPQELDYSLDGGKSWLPAPALADEARDQGEVGVRGDGSVVAQSKSGFYAWKVGDAGWQKVAPALAGIVNGSLVVFDQTSGKETLYLEVRPDQGNTFSFYSVDLP